MVKLVWRVTKLPRDNVAGLPKIAVTRLYYMLEELVFFIVFSIMLKLTDTVAYPLLSQYYNRIIPINQSIEYLMCYQKLTGQFSLPRESN